MIMNSHTQTMDIPQDIHEFQKIESNKTLEKLYKPTKFLRMRNEILGDRHMLYKSMRLSRKTKMSILQGVHAYRRRQISHPCKEWSPTHICGNWQHEAPCPGKEKKARELEHGRTTQTIFGEIRSGNLLGYQRERGLGGTGCTYAKLMRGIRCRRNVV